MTTLTVQDIDYFYIKCEKCDDSEKIARGAGGGIFSSRGDFCGFLLEHACCPADGIVLARYEDSQGYVAGDNLELVGATEFAEICGVTKQAVGNWQVRYPDFPKPTRLASGPVWTKQQAVFWKHYRKTERSE